MKKILCFLAAASILGFIFAVPGYAVQSDIHETDLTVVSALDYDASSTGNFDPGTEADEGRLIVQAGANVSYAVNVSKPGWYKLLLFGKRVNSSAGAAVTASVANAGADESLPIANKNITGSDARFTLGRFYLKAGENQIKLTVANDPINIRELLLKCVDIDVPATVGGAFIAANDYYISTMNQEDNQWNYRGTYKGDYINGDGNRNTGPVIAVGTSERTLTYRLNVAEDGLYGLKMYIACGKGFAELSLEIDGSPASGTKQFRPTEASGVLCDKIELDYFKMEAGQQELKIKAKGDSASTEVYIYAFILEKISDGISLEGVYANDIKLQNNAVIPRGLDTFVLHFTMGVSAESVNKNNIKLSSNNEDLDIHLEAEDACVYVTVKKTLDENTAYTLAFDGIIDKYGATGIGSSAYEFTTGGTDAGIAHIQMDKAQSDYEDITLTGKMEGSTGIGIEGRQVTVSVKDPQGNISPSPIAFAISEREGNFEVKYRLPQGSEVGIYTFIVSGEYVEVMQSIAVVYISAALESQYLTKLGATKDINEVKNFFAQHQEALGISVEHDMIDVADTDKVMEYFIGLKINSGVLFRQFYYSHIMLEKINQASTILQIDAALTDEAAYGYLGLDMQKLSLIVKNQNDFHESILNLPEVTVLETLINKINEMTEHWLAIEYEKTDFIPVAGNKSCYVGQSFSISLDFTETQRNISKLVYQLESDDTGIFDNAAVQLKAGAIAGIDNSGGRIKISIIFNNTQSIFLSSPQPQSQHRLCNLSK
jgi:hypothetical protein